LKKVLNKASTGFVIPAKAGIQLLWKPFWIPACAGMTDKETFQKTKVLQKFEHLDASILF
jgi:hypothetical protein